MSDSARFCIHQRQPVTPYSAAGSLPYSRPEGGGGIPYLFQLVMALIALQLPDRQLDAVQLAEVVHEAALSTGFFYYFLKLFFAM